ncbi:hypothetical protein BGZ76_008183 [Entomortierella beljakovae]|nr:hypothetical protein BGZ76_008183 [Entomortierella beljakovae]
MSLRPLPDPVDGNDVAVSDISESRHTYSSLLLHQQPISQAQERTHSQSLIRMRNQYISDADASSDFSEMDIHRDIYSDDYSDYETQFGGRWDLTAHWHLADYSEGVEGDADDDDDEERDNDTDLSEGLGRAINIDLGRVREILGSSPSSTPIVFPQLLRLGAATGTDGVRSSSLLTSRNTEFDSNSSASEELEDSQSRAHQVPTTPSLVERTVRFSWDLQETPSRHASHEAASATNEPSSTSTSEDHDTHSAVFHDEHLDDIQSRGNTQLEELNYTPGSSTRADNGSYSVNNESGNRGRTNNSNLRSISSGRGEIGSSPRTQESTRQLPSPIPQASIDQANFRTGGIRIYAYQNPTLPSSVREERRHQFRHPPSSLAPRQSLSSSSRGFTSPYWSVHNRQYQHIPSSSPLSSSSSSPSPISSNSSSRMASPVPDQSSPLIHKPDDEGICQLNLESDCHQHQNNGNEGNGMTGLHNTIVDRLDEAGCLLPPTTSIDTRRSISTNISSLPSFASSIFSPKFQAGCHGRIDGAGLLGMTGPNKSNHPRRQCCFLQPGQKFSGTQNLKSQYESLMGLRSRQQEEWNVNVTISSVDYEAGAVYGLMEAIGVPVSASNVITFWEGEIIDFENHTLWTKKWSAKAETDLEHWKRMEAFQGIDKRYIIKGAKTGKFRSHIDQKYIFMRWKEKHFVNFTEHSSGLTIAGFYYVSLRRSDGYVEGYYHDQESTPFQHLTLNPVFETNGYSSSIFEVA